MGFASLYPSYKLTPKAVNEGRPFSFSVGTILVNALLY